MEKIKKTYRVIILINILFILLLQYSFSQDRDFLIGIEILGYDNSSFEVSNIYSDVGYLNSNLSKDLKYKLNILDRERNILYTHYFTNSIKLEQRLQITQSRIPDFVYEEAENNISITNGSIVEKFNIFIPFFSSTYYLEIINQNTNKSVFTKNISDKIESITYSNTQILMIDSSIKDASSANKILDTNKENINFPTIEEISLVNKLKFLDASSNEVSGNEMDILKNDSNSDPSIFSSYSVLLFIICILVVVILLFLHYKKN